jgi:Domain of unknown function (DUF4388)
MALALQGTLDTFSLPDVLRLLATTRKTGRLRIEGDRGQGSVWLRDGRVVDVDADRAVEGAPTDEVIFELLRFGSGSFAFESDAQTPSAEHAAEVDDVLRRASALLSEWIELEAVVPSLEHRVSLSAELSTDEVTIDADRWRSVVAVAGGHSVGEVAGALGLGELHVSRAVRDLVELGVADVDGPDAVPEPPRLTDFGDLPGELPRRSAVPSRPRSTPPRDLPSIPSAPPSGRGSGEHVSEPALAGEAPRAGWRQPDRTTGPQSTFGPEGLAPSARAGNGQGRAPSGPSRPRRRPSPADGAPPSPPSPPSASLGSSASRAPLSSNGDGRPPSRPGRDRSAPPPSRKDDGRSTPPLLAPGAGTAPPERRPSDPGHVSRFSGDPPAAPRLTGEVTEASPAASPLSGDSSPFTGQSRLVPPPDAMGTGQIRAVSSAASPPEMHWAADDDAPGVPTGPMTSPFAGLTSLGPPRPRAGDAEVPPHLAAMSPEARAAVQASVGPTGGSTGAALRPSTGDDVAQRGRLINFLYSVR